MIIREEWQKLTREVVDPERPITPKRAYRRDTEHHRAVDAPQAQLGDVRHQAGVLQGRLDAVPIANEALQDQLAERRKAETDRSSSARAKTVGAHPAVGRPAHTIPGLSRKTAMTATAGKTAMRRKRGRRYGTNHSPAQTGNQGETGARSLPARPIGALMRYSERIVPVIA